MKLWDGGLLGLVLLLLLLQFRHTKEMGRCTYILTYSATLGSLSPTKRGLKQRNNGLLNQMQL
jgi:hypothetical protein